MAEEKHAAHGILFYAALYVNIILLAVGILTGRWIFLLLILLTLGLTTYMMYLMTHNAEHLKEIGSWAETVVLQALAKLQGLWK